MTTTIPAARQKLIERIAQSARALKRRGDPLDVQEFVRQYYRGVGEEDLAEYRPETLAALALAHLRSASLRKPNQAPGRKCRPIHMPISRKLTPPRRPVLMAVPGNQCSKPACRLYLSFLSPNSRLR